MIDGTIVKGIGGFYYVDTNSGIYECKARGIFRKDGIIPYVGDNVRISPINEEEGVIEEILPRKNTFIRPPMANVDCLILVISISKPEVNLNIVDRFLVAGEQRYGDIIICINKIDLDKDDKLKRLNETYKDLYPVVKVSSLTGDGIDELARLLKGKKSALAGPSGVGKSTILNMLMNKDVAETGRISKKTGRGKHTTRHVELYELSGGGYIFDTPGFTSFDTAETEEDQLQFLFPEISALVGKCRYDNCRHLSEPGCAIKEALSQGKIKTSRYKSYEEQMKEIQSRREY